MFDPAGPLANRGPEGLQQLLVSGAAAAHEQIRHLTLSELTDLAAAADQLANLARMYVHRVCGNCGAPIVWFTSEPTGQGAGWRHVDQMAMRREGAHRATLPIAPSSTGGAA